jgi:hypothetical protein
MDARGECGRFVRWERASLLLAASGILACTPDRPTPRDQVAGAPRIATTTAAKVDNFGYRPSDTKVAVFSADPGASVLVRTPAGEVVFDVPKDGGTIDRKGWDAASGDQVWWVDLSSLRESGTYHLYSPALRAHSYEFVIAPDVYRDVMRAALRTFYLQRCGIGKTTRYAQAWADEAPCHRADASMGPAPGQKDHGLRDLAGGWHDAGDYNKYVWYATSNAILFMLRAFEDNPRAFSDGDLDIPESGNGVADLLDEVKWELDFLLKMRLPGGAVLSQVHAGNQANGASPPSADATPRFYLDPTSEAGAVLAGSCALASRVFATAGQESYAATLREAALSTWGWLQEQTDSDQKVWAAAEVFRMEPSVESARQHVDGYHPAGWSNASLNPAAYDTHAAITYLQAPGATPAVVSAMRASIGRAANRVFASDDLYRNGMPREAYHWGSNSIRAAHGVFLLHAARLGVTGSHTAADCRRHAQDFLHFFHGQNPLSMVYLTNMASRGGEHSSWQLFHNWFGQSQSAHAKSNYVGKPSSIVELHYPYLGGADNHGIRDDKTSAFGPAPGFVPGGPNGNYSGSAIPPGRAVYPNRCYRDWNDQTVWTARTWEITENSIGYQGPYVALAAAFVAR